MLEEAFALHQRGSFAEAERAYAELLRCQLKNFRAMHLLGLLSVQRQENERGIALMRQALALEPRQPLILYDLGNALQKIGRSEEALASYDEALALKPDLVEIHYNRAIALTVLQRQDQALASYDRAIALKPDYAQAYNNRGVVLLDQRRAAEAFADFSKAIALKVDYVKALNNRGRALADLDRLQDALKDHDRAITLAPNYLDSHLKRAGVLVSLKRKRDALESYDRAIVLDPNSADAHDGRGTALALLNQPLDALQSHERALALDPESANFHNNRGTALMTLGRLEEALESLDQAIALKPRLVQAHNNRGLVLDKLKRPDAALESYSYALALDPQSAEANLGCGTMLLLAGRFEEGWPFYEWRKRKMGEALNARGKPEWTGEKDISGKILFIEAEQGFGDTIQFCRYAPLVADLGPRRVILTARDALTGLLQSLDPRVEVVPAAASPTEFDYHVALLSLPKIFGAKEGNIPTRTPYLRVEPEVIEQWRNKIGRSGFKIGVIWQGSADSNERSFPLALLADLERFPAEMNRDSHGSGKGRFLPGDSAWEVMLWPEHIHRICANA